MKTTREVKRYSEEELQNALNDIKLDTSIRQAAKKFNVPFTTLLSRHNGTYSGKIRKGPATVLSNEEETELVNWILKLGKTGYPVTRVQLLDSVKLICKNSKKKRHL